MKKYSDITYKYLKTQKKKSILTIIGIILSVALISSMGTMFFSLKENQINRIKSEKGDYHFGYINANKDLYSKIRNNPLVDNLSIYTSGEKISFKKNNYIHIDSLNKKGFDMLPVNIEKGRKPEKLNEIVIEKWALEVMENKPKINDKVKFMINGKEKEFLLTGVLQNDDKSQYEQYAKAITLSPESIQNENNNMLLVKLKEDISIKKYINEFKNKGKYKKFVTNGELLAILGQSENNDINKAIIVTEVILNLLVVISTVVVIYNAFHISVLERIKQFGILRSIGGTPKQIRKIVLKEASVLSIIGIPLGIISGVFGLKLVLYLIGSERLMTAKQMVISPYVLIASCIVGLIAVYLSAILPAYRASKVSPLDAIYNRGSIKKEKIKKYKNPILKFLKIESLLSYKNMKRNKKKFRITKISIIISVVLFVVVSNFLNMTLNFQNTDNEDLNISYELKGKDTKENRGKITNEYYEKIKNIKGVDKVYKNFNPIYIKPLIPLDKMNDKFLKLLNESIKKIKDNKDKEYTVCDTLIDAYEHEKLNVTKKYLKSGNIDENKFNEENGVIVGGKVELRDKENNKNIVTEVTNLNVGDEIELDINDNAYGEGKYPKKTFKVKVMGVLKNEPFGLKTQGFHIITTPKVFKKIQNSIDKNLFRKFSKQSNEEKQKQYNQISKDFYICDLDVITKKDADKEKISSYLSKIANEDSFVNFIDKEAIRKQKKQDVLQFRIFLYGFIAVISLIGSLNIINTVSTNLILRKREFATLKSIGMSMKQINKMVIQEGILYGTVGALYGVIASIPLSYLMYKNINSVKDFGWKIPWQDMIIALVGSIVIVLISMIIPLKRIRRGNVIEDIRVED